MADTSVTQTGLRRIPGGRGAEHRFLLGFFFGPYIINEFDRINASEKAVIQGGGGETSAFPVARVSYAGLSRSVTMKIAAGNVLPLPSNRDRGETLEFFYHPDRTTLMRLYDLYYHPEEGGASLMGAVRNEQWEDLADCCFGHIGTGYPESAIFKLVMDKAATIAAALCFSVVDPDILQLVNADKLAHVVSGDARQFRAARSLTREMDPALMVALASLLYHRKGGEAARAALRSVKAGDSVPAKFEDLAWAFMPDFRISSQYQLYEKVLKGVPPDVSKPGPKPKPKPKPQPVATPEVPKDTTPAAPAPTPPSVAQPSSKPDNPASAAPVDRLAALAASSHQLKQTELVASRTLAKPTLST